jgi:hypothetical protein
MAGNPLVPQGTLNRLRGSLILSDFPALNVTASFLGKEAITMLFETEASQQIQTMTGTVTSPEPFQMVLVSAHVLKTQALSNAYKAQIEKNTNIGDLQVKSDASTLSNYQLANCSIVGVEPLDTTGTKPDFIVKIRGTYYINSDLFNAA